MPQVPVYSTPQALPDELPNVKQQTPYRMMQGAEIGPAQTKAMGQALTTLGKDVSDITTAEQIKQNEAAVKSNNANVMGDVQAILYGTPDQPDSGYLNQKGNNATGDAFDTVVQRLQQIPQQRGQDLTNEAQQKLAHVPNQMVIQAAIKQATEHRNRQADVADAAAGQTRIAVAQNGATLAFNPVTDKATPMTQEEFYGKVLDEDAMPSAYQQYLQTIRSETLDQAHRAGVTDKDVQDQMVKDALGKVYMGVLGQLLDGKNTKPGNVKLAQAYFDEVKDGLSAEQQDRVKTVLEVGANKDASLQLFYDASKQGDGTAQRDYVDQQFKDGKISADVHDMTMQRIDHAEALRREQQTETDKKVIGQAWETAHQGGTLASLPASMLAYIKDRGLGPHIDAIFKRGETGGSGGAGLDTAGEAKLYVDLARMSVDDPSAFVNADLSKFAGQLSAGHFNHLITLQLGISKQDAKAMDLSKLVHNAVNDTMATIRAAGMTPTAKPGSTQAQSFDQFEASLRDSLAAAQAANGDKPLTREQARQVTMGLLKDQALSGTGLFGLGMTHKPVWKMTPDERKANWEVPTADRQQIVESLKRKGMPVTEDNIQRAYKYSQGVR